MLQAIWTHLNSEQMAGNMIYLISKVSKLSCLTTFHRKHDYFIFINFEQLWLILQLMCKLLASLYKLLIIILIGELTKDPRLNILRSDDLQISAQEGFELDEIIFDKNVLKF